VTASRIVSLCPSITETIVEIGGRDRLVAATKFCTRPRGVLRGLPRVGGTKSPDVARILALRPDLVFANEEENRAEDVAALREAGVEVDVTFPKTVAQVPADVRQWGGRLGGACEEEADALAREIERGMTNLASAPPPAPFRYAYWIWMDPWMTVSDDTYVADLLRRAGGENVYAGDATRYPATTPEDAIALGARTHFFPDEPFPFRAGRHEASTAERFGPESRRLFVAGDDYCWHGYRTRHGLEAMRLLRERMRSEPAPD
jgi:ABC-type Fe3+-hydroxamate transport system substrate-binding protein